MKGDKWVGGTTSTERSPCMIFLTFWFDTDQTLPNLTALPMQIASLALLCISLSDPAWSHAHMCEEHLQQPVLCRPMIQKKYLVLMHSQLPCRSQTNSSSSAPSAPPAHPPPEVSGPSLLLSRCLHLFIICAREKKSYDTES